MAAVRYYTPSEERSGGKGKPNEFISIDGRKSPHKKNDPFPGPAPLLEERKKSHKRGIPSSAHAPFPKWMANRPSNTMARRLTQQERLYQDATDQAARHDLLMMEDAGFIETDCDQKSYTIKQYELKHNVDIASSCKQFELNLNQFGPYRIDYTRNGRHLLLGGQLGHVAAFEWISKKLICEINVMESVNDVRWLHTENMFAIAQKKWTYVYDNQGTELHCLKGLYKALRLDFLPYHFLLVASTDHGFLQYIDISIGKEIVSLRTKSKRLNVMTQNPNNAVVLLGHHNGTVSMWSPNMKDPLVTMLCHRNAVRAITVDKSGLYMATSGQDGHIRIFDIRKHAPIHSYKVMRSPSNLEFSQRGLLAASFGNIVEIYKDPCREIQEEPYLMHKLRHPAEVIQFCPYEDVLGVGRQDGFESLLIPGSGEPNYDSLESNPRRSKSQRREWEVKALLEKIQPDMISLDPFHIGAMDKVTAHRLQKDKEEQSGHNVDKSRSQLKYKMKGKSSTGNIQKRKESIRSADMREKIKRESEEKSELLNVEPSSEQEFRPKSALDRFRKKS